MKKKLLFTLTFLGLFVLLFATTITAKRITFLKTEATHAEENVLSSNGKISSGLPNTLYVKKGGTGLQNGVDWDNAIAEFADALQTAKQLNAGTPGTITQIWVSGGNYKPMYSSDDGGGSDPASRLNSFVLLKDVNVYGGFAGTEETLADRNLKLTTNETELDGDLGTQGTSTDNAYHVVIAVGINITEKMGNARLDGFTVKNGYANGSAEPYVNGIKIFSKYGAGIFAFYSTANLENINVINNVGIGGGYGGGGIYAESSIFSISNSSIKGNKHTSQPGGGLYNENCAINMTNVIFSGNTSDRYSGGAIGSYLSNCILTNVTICSNRAGSNGAIFLFGGSLKLRNSLIYKNNSLPSKGGYSNQIGISYINGEINGDLSIEYSLVQNLTHANDGSHNLESDVVPSFVSPVNAGLSSNGDYRLEAGSPGINEGNNQFFSPGEIPDLSDFTTDLDGNPRIVAGTVDIGAYENQELILAPDVNGIIYVTQTGNGDFSGSSWGNATNNFQEAINTTGVQQVWVAGGTYQPTMGQSFVMKEGVKIYGGFAGIEEALNNRNLGAGHNAILKGNNARVINNNNITLTSSALLDGFVITEGEAIIEENDGNLGGGMLLNNSSPSLNNLIFYNNTSTGSGGGLSIFESSPLLTNIVFVNNHSTSEDGSGGGLSINNGSAPIITNVTFSHNEAPNSVGGGLYKEYNSGAKLINAVFYGNTAGNNDNDIYYDGTNPSLITYSYLQSAIIGTGNIQNTDDPFINSSNPAGADGLWGTDDDGLKLKSGSPAINAGSNAAIMTTNITTDFSGKPRIRGGIVDMGAYEYPLPTPDAHQILYVKKGAIGNGNSWAQALGELADALKGAELLNALSPGTVSEIWVAGGTYLPLYIAGNGTSDRDKAFLLVKDVRIFGGFKGDEDDLLQRDLTLTNNTTILSGDLKTLNDNSDNAFHVIISAGDVGNAELNGFTIKDGNANNEDGSIIVNSKDIVSNYGGGIYNDASSAIFNNVIITDNLSSSFGGGIFNTNSSSPKMTNVLVSNNSAYDGGGISNVNSSSPIMTNVLISNNSADHFGGGIYNFYSIPALYNVTISGNTASGEGNEWFNGGGTPVIRNSIIYGNGVAGQLYDVKNSLIQNQEGNNNYADVNNNNLPTDTDPLFVNSGNGDYHLQPSSPAIDGGKNSFFNLLEDGDKDLAGNLRIQGNTIDMGAYENPISYNPTNGVLYVKKNTGANIQNGIRSNNASSYGGGWDNAIPELADALKGAGQLNTATPGTVTQIWVAQGTYKPYYRPDDMTVTGDNNSNPAFALLKDVKIYGSFEGIENSLSERTASVITAHPSKLSGFLSPAYSAFHVVISAGDVGDAELNGFTISDGLANGDSHNTISVNSEEVSQAYGGGIYLINSSPSIFNVTVQNNQAALSGGGIYADGSKSSITNSTISGNASNGGGGGGITITDLDNSTHSVIMTNVLIIGNSAGYGSGIYNEESSPVLTNVTISGNSTEGIHNYNSNVQIRNSIIYGNEGDGIYNNMGSVPVITYSLVQGLSDNDDGNIDGSTNPSFMDATGGDYHLALGSPVINIGNNAYFASGADPDLFAITSDRDGRNRIKETIDFGAYEFESSVLHVNLLRYIAVAQGNKAKLEWTTASETNNKEYIVSHAIDGKAFTQIGKVTGSLNSASSKDYVFYDSHPENGINYYRLEQVDMDGRIADLGIRTVSFSFSDEAIKLYPNPTRNRIKIEFAPGKYQSLELMDVNGKLLQRIRVGIIENQKNLDLSNRASGVYFVRLIGESSVIKKVVKE